MWSTQRILNLIDDIRCSPCLWDMRHTEYRNRAVKQEAYEAIGRKYGVSAAEIAKKFQILRTQFRREMKRVLSLKKPSQWFGYQPLMFLNYDPEDQSEDQILVSLSDCESAAPTHDTALIKSEVVESDTGCENYMEFESSSSSKNIEVNIVEDPDSQHLLRYARKAISRNSSPWNRDEFSVYGEHIANKLRNCGRSRLEIAIAQHEIDNICFKLTMGGYKEQPEDASAEAALVSVSSVGDVANSDDVSSATAQE